MELVFTKSSSLLSILIRWGLNEPYSHFAVLFDGRFVMHSNLYGINLSWYNTFRKHSKVMAKISIPISVDGEELIYRNLLDSFDGRHYDYAAFFYFAWRVILFKFFKIALPKKNRFGNKDAFLCTEVAGLLPLGLTLPDLGIISPYTLFLILKNHLAAESIKNN